MVSIKKTKLLTVIGLVILYIALAAIGIYILSTTSSSKQQTPTQTTMEEPSPEKPSNPNAKMYTGTIKLGSTLKDTTYCSSGLYVVADDGAFIVDDKSMLLLRYLDGSNGIKLYEDETYVDKQVTVTGELKEMQCEALTCECEAYILVDSIKE